MKTSHGIGLGTLVTFLSAATWLGCGGDDTLANPTVDGGGGMDGTMMADTGGNKDTGTKDQGNNQDMGMQQDMGTQDMGTQDMGANETGNDAGDSGGGDGGDAAALDCTGYCTIIQAACTATATTQFKDTASCMAFCAQYPPGMAGDMTGYSLACRTYHATAAQADPTTHCQHAGPTGGDLNPNGTAGTCGEPCDAFCNTAQVICTGANQQWADNATCVTACKAFPVDIASFSTADVNRNDMGCRTYHLENAVADPVTHCPHIATVSVACTM